jgi:tetratricopeptide (TPR) repeat protein
MLVLMLAVAGCGKSPDEKRQAYMESAREYQEQGKYAEAAIQYQNALQIAPDDATALVSLGEAQLKLNRPQEAYASFSKASKADPKNVKAREYLASMLLLAKRYDMAEKEARQSSRSIPAMSWPGRCLPRHSSWAESGTRGRFHGRMLKGPHPTEEMYINTIQMYMPRQDRRCPGTHRQGFRPVPQVHEDTFHGERHLCPPGGPRYRPQMGPGRYKVSDGSVTAGVALAMFYARNNMDELYRNQLAAMKQKHPESPEPYLLEATILHTKKDLDGALKAARKARELKNSTQVRTLISQILLEKKEPKQAKELLTESMKEDARDVLSRVLLAQIYLDEKNAATALEVLGEPLKTAALSPDVASTAAQAYMLKGDVKKARELVENALREHDQNISLHRTMAKIHFLQGDFKKALTETELLVSHSVGTPDILYIGALSALRTSAPKRPCPTSSR